MKIVKSAKHLLNLIRISMLKKGLFLHIQKTAGSSLITFARQHYRDNLISHGDFVGHHPDEFKNTKFISGHFGYDFAKHLIDDRYSFTFLRNPIERILSFYYFHRTRKIDEFPITRKAHELDLEDFLALGLTEPYIQSRIWNNQVWQLAHGYDSPHSINDFSEETLLDRSIKNLKRFSHIGFVETFEQDMEIIMPCLGIQYSKKNPLPKANTTKNRLQISELPSSTLSILNELTSLDRKLYEYAQTIRTKPEKP